MTAPQQQATSVGTGSTATDRLMLTTEEAAERLGIGRTLMYSLVRNGEIESVTIGRLRRIPAECLNEYVQRLRSSRQQSKTAA